MLCGSGIGIRVAIDAAQSILGKRLPVEGAAIVVIGLLLMLKLPSQL